MALSQVPLIGLQLVIVVFPDHTHLLFESRVITVINLQSFTHNNPNIYLINFNAYT